MTRKGKIQTVKGVIDPKDLGMTMTHEHVFIEFPSTMNIPPEESHKKQVYNEPISLKNRGLIYHHGRFDIIAKHILIFLLMRYKNIKLQEVVQL